MVTNTTVEAAKHSCCLKRIFFQHVSAGKFPFADFDGNVKAQPLDRVIC